MRSPRPRCAASSTPATSPSSGPRRSRRRRCGRCVSIDAAFTAPRCGTGPRPSQLLDVWRPKELPAEPAPVLIFVPGGAWVHGSRHPAGIRVDVAPGRAGLGVSVHRLPGGAASPVARAHHRRQDRDRLGARQRRQVRWRPRVRRGRGHFGGRAPGGAGRSDAQRPGAAGRPAGGFGHVRRRGGRASTAATTGRTVRPSNGCGSSTSWNVWWSKRKVAEAARSLPQGVPDRAGSSPMRRRSSSSTAPVTASSRWRRPAASSNGCARCRGRWSSYVELPGAGHAFDMTDGARTGSAGDRNRVVPQPDSPKPDAGRGQGGYIAPPEGVAE